MQRNRLDAWKSVDTLCSAALKVNVFTSSSCPFCSETLATIYQVVEKFANQDIPVEVVETSVEDNPEIVEEQNAIALPMIVVGNSKLIGLPRSEDIELLIHRTMLSG
ncbi:MAG: thioredoxin family protein [Promethearchaeota archaeon]